MGSRRTRPRAASAGGGGSRRSESQLLGELEESLRAQLGEEGWDLADAAVEDFNHPAAFTVKVYTDWGWAGFASGTIADLADFFREVRDEHERLRGSGLTDCPECGSDHWERVQEGKSHWGCDCGVQVLVPAAWVVGAGSAQNVSPILTAVLQRQPTGEELEDATFDLALHQMIEGGWEFDTDDADLSLGGVLPAFVAGIKHVRIHSQQVLFIPASARWERPNQLEALEGLLELGYELDQSMSQDYGRTRVQGCLALDLPAAGSSAAPPGLPRQVQVRRARGQVELVVSCDALYDLYASDAYEDLEAEGWADAESSHWDVELQGWTFLPCHSFETYSMSGAMQAVLPEGGNFEDLLRSARAAGEAHVQAIRDAVAAASATERGASHGR